MKRLFYSTPEPDRYDAATDSVVVQVAFTAIGGGSDLNGQATVLMPIGSQAAMLLALETGVAAAATAEVSKHYPGASFDVSDIVYPPHRKPAS